MRGNESQVKPEPGESEPSSTASGVTSYLLVLMLVLVLAFVANMRFNGVFACPANAYGDNRYLAYCESTAYGDYDHGAVWFDLEPTVLARARAAETLFIGNSRMQFGFSAPALGRWFAEEGRTYYLLGFSHSETTKYVGPVLARLAPQPRAYVINADEFFEDRWTGPGQEVIQGQDSARRYGAKRLWQIAHRELCGQNAGLCGDTMGFYRQRDTGEWVLAGTSPYPSTPIETTRPLNLERLEQMRVIAAEFIAGLDVDRSCILITYVPQRNSDRPTMAALAEALGLPFVSPEPEGLLTFDGSHLDRDSAERFASAFFEEAGPRLRQCLQAGSASEGEASPGVAP